MAGAQEPDPLIGMVFAGRYKIARLLGEGDRKRTYLAKDTVIPRQVAVAVIKPTAAGADPEGTRREAEALARAGTHENVVTFFDWGRADGGEFLVFDYLPGGTLRQLIAKRQERGRPLPTEDVMRYGRQLARALAHVHRLGLIHRDVAPGNVWLDERRFAHLGDFDSAVSRDDASAPAGLPPTTEAYAAPEQLAGGGFDQRADLYSLGAVLYEALTGERPERMPLAELSKRMIVRRPDAPRSLAAVICSLLSPSPDDRPPSAERVLAALSDKRVRRGVSEGLESWSDALPFPLASILWHCQGEPGAGAKIDYLLKFFEALAQFAATVLLSGCRADAALAAHCPPTWFGAAGGQPLDMRRPTFGTWLTLTGRVAKTVRSVLDEGGDRCGELFATSDSQLIEALASADLVRMLQGACEIRNSEAHGGVPGSRVLDSRLGDLRDLLDRVRALLGWSFESWTLLKPGPMMLSRMSRPS